MSDSEETSLADDGWSIASTGGSAGDSDNSPTDDLEEDFAAYARAVVAIAVAAVAVHYALGMRRSST
jgi:hypothetical protein